MAPRHGINAEALPMNRFRSADNFMSHMRHEVVREGSWSLCTAGRPRREAFHEPTLASTNFVLHMQHKVGRSVHGPDACAKSGRGLSMKRAAASLPEPLANRSKTVD